MRYIVNTLFVLSLMVNTAFVTAAVKDAEREITKPERPTFEPYPMPTPDIEPRRVPDFDPAECYDDPDIPGLSNCAICVAWPCTENDYKQYEEMKRKENN